MKPAKSQTQTYPLKNRGLSPNETYTDQNEKAPHALLIGTKTGQCDICKEIKQTLLLRYGFSLCEDCLNVCTTILEQLELDETKPTETSGRKTGPSRKQK